MSKYSGQGAATFAGYAGVTLSIAIANIGAAYGTAKAGIGITGMGQRKPSLIMKSLIPIIMAGILGVYGMIVSVLLVRDIDYKTFNYWEGYKKMSAGICVGFSSLAAGYAIGLVGDVGVRCNSQQPKLFVGMLLILIFAEALGLYGMIVAILINNK